jgi:hypothetical protein
MHCFNMRKQVKVNAIAFANMCAAMIPGDMNCRELAEETGLHYLTVCQYTRELWAAGAAHIARRDPDVWGRHNIIIYKLGPGRDAPKVRLTAYQRTKNYRERKAQRELLHVMAGSLQNA